MILPTITTISPGWRDKVRQISEFGIKEVNVFPTCLMPKERQEFYELIEKAGVKKIPFVHLRGDMPPSELDFLITKYKTEVFNIHTPRENPIKYDYGKYRNIIYIENTHKPFDEEEIKKFAGVCVDFSHLENARVFRPAIYEHNIKIIEKYKCGCNHISPDKDFSLFDHVPQKKHHPHVLEDLSQLDYLKNYPIQYFSDYIAMELENSIEDQLKAIEYIKSFGAKLTIGSKKL